MSEELLREVRENLKLLVRLAALELINGRSQKEAIHLLSQAGFLPKQIAELLGTSANTVSVELSRKRSEKSAKRN